MKPFESDAPNEYQAFLQSPAWAQLRADVFRRDGHKCRICGCESQLQAHHVRYRNERGDQELDNPRFLITLCKPCHQILTTAVERARAIKADVPGFSVSLWAVTSDGFAEQIKRRALGSVYGQQQAIMADALFEFYKRSLKPDATPINIGNLDVHNRLASILAETLEHQAGWYVGWLCIRTKMKTDELVMNYRADFYNHYRADGCTDSDIQQLLKLNANQMAKLREAAKRRANGGEPSG